MSTIPKIKRISIRIKNSQKEYLTYAAGLQHKKFSAFIIDSALKEAQEIVSHRTQFDLSPVQWKSFSSALEKPARTIPQLKKLFKG